MIDPPLLSWIGSKPGKSLLALSPMVYTCSQYIAPVFCAVLAVLGPARVWRKYGYRTSQVSLHLIRNKGAPGYHSNRACLSFSRMSFGTGFRVDCTNVIQTISGLTLSWRLLPTKTKSTKSTKPTQASHQRLFQITVPVCKEQYIHSSQVTFGSSIYNIPHHNLLVVYALACTFAISSYLLSY